MSDGIIPCPYCGNNILTVVTRSGKDGFRDRYCVLCDYNDGGCGAESGWYHNKEEAIERWNTRSPGWVYDEPPKRNGWYIVVYREENVLCEEGCFPARMEIVFYDADDGFWLIRKPVKIVAWMGRPQMPEGAR